MSVTNEFGFFYRKDKGVVIFKLTGCVSYESEKAECSFYRPFISR